MRVLPHTLGPAYATFTESEYLIFRSNFNVICPVQSSPKKHSASRRTQISTTTSAVSSLNEGRIAIVTDVGMGCGGRGSVGRERGCRAGFKPVSNQERSYKLAAMQRPRLGARRPIFGNSIGIALHRDIW
jgi:hypothetical protein